MGVNRAFVSMMWAGSMACTFMPNALAQECGPAAMDQYSLLSSVDSIPAIGHDLSGVSVNGDTGNLYFVRDNADDATDGWVPNDGGAAGTDMLENPALWEYSVAANDDTQLTLERQIEMEGFDDIEAVVWMDGSRVAVLEEERMRICVLDLAGVPTGASTKSESDCESLITITGAAAQCTAGCDANGGGEGLGWDAANSRFLLGKERSPLAVFAVPLSTTGVQTFDTTTEDDQLLDLSASSSQQETLNGVAFSSVSDEILSVDLGEETVCVYPLDGSSSAALPRNCLDLGLAARDGQTPHGTAISTIDTHSWVNGVALAPRSDAALPPDLLVVSEPTLLLRYRAADSATCAGSAAPAAVRQA